MKLWCETFLPSSKLASVHSKSNKYDIVLLHGTGSNARMWKQQIDFFTNRGHACTVLDLRGHGQSHEPYEKTDLAVHRQDVLHTLTGSGVSFPAYFIGHSLGAIVALDIAEKNPELVKSVFAACIPAKLCSPVKLFFAAFIHGPMQALRDSPLKGMLPWREQTLLEMPQFTMEEIASYFSSSDLIKKTPQVNLPVHVAAARFDPLALHWHTKKLHKQLPQSTFKLFEWAGHNVMDYRAQEFNSWIVDYLE